MNFLNPALFAILAPLLALPLLIHLFNRKFPNTIPFPDIKRIKKSLSERSSLMRWRHWLMTLLRTLAVACLLFAFLKPVLPRFGSENARRDSRRVLLIVDRSPSLLHREGAGTSAARNLLSEAGKILATLKDKDQINAILAGTSAKKLLPEFTTSPDSVRAALAALPPGYERIDVEKAMSLASALMESAGENSEIYLLSDFQRTNWASASFDGLPESTRLFIVNVSGGTDRNNRAVLSADLSSSSPATGELVKLDVQLANWSSDPVTLPVEAIIDGRSSISDEITLAAWASGRVKMDFTAPGPGAHTIEIKIPEDGLPTDDRRYTSFEVREREEVYVLTDADPKKSGATFVETALNPFAKGGAFSPRVIPSNELTPARLSSASRIILTGASQLSPDLTKRLVAYMEQGNGLLYFLNGPSDQENLLAIDQAFGGPGVPFHVAGTLSVENFGGKPQRIARGDFDSRFLRLFQGENRQILGLLEFYEIRRALPTGEGEVLLYFSDGTPALGVAYVGLGTAVFCNFSPAELSSNLARQRLFPAWIQEIVKNLSPESLPQLSHETGATLTADLWRADFESGALLDPNGKTIIPRLNGDKLRVVATFAAPLPGIYQLNNKGEPAWLQTVNLHPDESDLRSLDLAELKNRAADALTRDAHQIEGAGDYAALTSGRPVFHWFLLGIAMLLLVEMLMQRPFQRAAGS